MKSWLDRILRLRKAKKGIKYITRELFWYSVGNTEDYHCEVITAQRLDLLLHRYKLKCTYNDVKFNWMKSL